MHTFNLLSRCRNISTSKVMIEMNSKCAIRIWRWTTASDKRYNDDADITESTIPQRHFNKINKKVKWKHDKRVKHAIISKVSWRVLSVATTKWNSFHFFPSFSSFFFCRFVLVSSAIISFRFVAVGWPNNRFVSLIKHVTLSHLITRFLLVFIFCFRNQRNHFDRFRLHFS